MSATQAAKVKTKNYLEGSMKFIYFKLWVLSIVPLIMMYGAFSYVGAFAVSEDKWKQYQYLYVDSIMWWVTILWIIVTGVFYYILSRKHQKKLTSSPPCSET